MAEIINRTKAALDRTPHILLDKEAAAVLALNDAAARLGLGRYYYLPESKQPRKNQKGCVALHSVVPRLMYTASKWRKSEIDEYWKLDDKKRYDHVQGNIEEDLHELDVLPMNLVVKDKGMTSLTWPVNSMARIVVYQGGDWVKCFLISEWKAKAKSNTAGDTHTVSMFQRSGSVKVNNPFMQSANANGRIGGAIDLPRMIEEMTKSDADGTKETDTGEVELAAGMKKSEAKERTYVAGSEVLRALNLEAVDQMLARIDAVKVKTEC